MLTRPQEINSFFTKGVKWTTLVLALIYLVNCLTPLRLHVDSIRYFRLEECMENLCAPNSIGAHDYLPYGYTATLLVLSKIGLLKSGAIVALNCLFLYAGLQMLKRMAANAVQPMLFIALVLLNWSIIKFVTHPLSEMQFIFFSFASLYSFHRYTIKRSWWLLVMAFVLALLTILTRTAGVALLPALVLSLAWMNRKRLTEFYRHHRPLVIIVFVVAIAAVVSLFLFSKQLGIDFYASFVTNGASRDLTGFLVSNFSAHLLELAELMANMSSVKLYRVLNPAVAHGLFLVIGLVFLGVILYNLFRKQNKLPLVLRLYLGFYLLLIFNWPFYDPRFLVPALPLMIAVLLQTPIFRSSGLKMATVLYLTVYSCVGIAAVGFHTYNSLNKEPLARNQANGVYRNEYETLFFGKPQSDTAKKVDQEILTILQRHD